jgi:uncharacterized membrane protein
MPTPLSPRSVRLVWMLTLFGTSAWLAAIFLAPWLAARGASGPARLIYAVFAPLCHQIPDRCFTWGGYPLAVCGRCLGIYAGFAAGLVLYPLVRGFSRIALPDVRLFLLLTLPMAVDAGAGLVGLWKSPILLRAASGFAWGTVLPFYFVTGVVDFIRLRRERRALEKRGIAKGAAAQ